VIEKEKDFSRPSREERPTEARSLLIAHKGEAGSEGGERRNLDREGGQ